MREIDQIRLLKPGQMPKAEEWNAIVRHLQAKQPTRAGYDGTNGTAYKKEVIPYRQPILFYKDGIVNEYSYFQFRRSDEIKDGVPVFYVGRGNDDEADNIVEGEIGTSGENSIISSEGGYFYGYTLDPHYADILNIGSILSTYYDTKAGYEIDGTFHLGHSGVLILGEYNASEGLYYCTKDPTQQEVFLAWVDAEPSNNNYLSSFYNAGVGIAKIYLYTSISDEGISFPSQTFDVEVYNLFPEEIHGVASIAKMQNGLWHIVGYKPQETCVPCIVTGAGDVASGYDVDLYANGLNSQSTGSAKLFFLELAYGSVLPSGSRIMGHYIGTNLIGGNE